MPVFELGRLRLHYTTAGTGPPLVLVHGLSGSRRWWRRNLPALEREYALHVVELVGFGQSRRQRPLSIRRGAELLEAFLDGLGLERPRVIGHSMGGHIALHLAAARPERVERLVLVAASGLVRGEWWRMMAKLPQAALYGALDFLPTLALDAARAGPRSLYAATLEILRDDVTDLLAHVRCPTLLVWGGRDVLVPRAMGERLAAAIPGSRLVVVPGAGHNVMYDRAAEFDAAVLPFLRGEAG